MKDFKKLAKSLAEAASSGHSDDALVGDERGIDDSDTNASLIIEKRVFLTVNGEPASLFYTKATPGRIYWAAAGTAERIRLVMASTGSASDVVASTDGWRALT